MSDPDPMSAFAEKFDGPALVHDTGWLPSWCSGSDQAPEGPLFDGEIARGRRAGQPVQVAVCHVCGGMITVYEGHRLARHHPTALIERSSLADDQLWIDCPVHGREARDPFARDRCVRCGDPETTGR